MNGTPPTDDEAASRRCDPLAVVAALVHHVDCMRAAAQPGAPLHVNAADLMAAVGYAPWHLRAYRPHLHLARATLMALGFTRGGQPIHGTYRLQPGGTVASCSTPATAQAKRTDTGPKRTNTTQRRLAAEKCVRSGGVHT